MITIKFMKYTLSAFFVSILVSGCASQISQPVASRPLVEFDYTAEIETVSEGAWPILEEAPSGTLISLNNQQLVLTRRYHAASGGQCRLLDFANKQNNGFQSHIVCKAKGKESWHFTKPIISHYENNAENDG